MTGKLQINYKLVWILVVVGCLYRANSPSAAISWASAKREREHWQACLVVHFPDSVVQHITDEIVKGIIEGISVIL